MSTKKNWKINNILCVQVPKDITWWNFIDNDLNNFITNELSLGKRFLQYGKSSTMFGKEVTNRVYYDPETFYCCQHYDNAIIIGKLSELTNEDCEEFVYRNIINKGEQIDEFIVEEDILFGWKNYINNRTVQPSEFDSAKESFISLLQSEGIDTSKEYIIIKLL